MLYSNTLAKQLLFNQGRSVTWRNPQMTSGSMAELLDVIKGELVTTPVEQQTVISANTPVTVVPPFPLELRDAIDMAFMTSFNTAVVPAEPDFTQISSWRNVEIVSPLTTGPYNTGVVTYPTANPEDLDGDVWLNEQLGGSSLAALSSQCSGKAVLIQRGALDFDIKIRNAVAAGANMVILYNGNTNGNSTFTIALNVKFYIPIFTIGNNTGHKILSYLRSDRKLYATIESLAYSPTDNYMRLRITEELTVPPTVSYPLIFTGALQATLTNGYTGLTSVLYNVTASKPAAIYFVNRANNENTSISISGIAPCDLTYFIVCNREYTIMNSIAQEIAPPITRPPISNNPTVLLKSPTFGTDTAVSSYLRNIITVSTSVATVIAFRNAVSYKHEWGYTVTLGTNTLLMDSLSSTTNKMVSRIRYNMRLVAVDLNTGSPVRVSIDNGVTSINNYEFVRYSCLITNISVVGNTITFTSDNATVVDIILNPTFPNSRFYYKSAPIVVGVNTIGTSGLRSGTYGFFDANTTITWGTSGSKQLATFTLP